MKLKYLGLALVLFSGVAMAQDRIDTLYYNHKWEGVPQKEVADFYRVAVYPQDTAFQKMFKDYRMTGELQTSGSFIRLDKYNDANTLFDGECITYYKSGNKESVAHYQEGVLHGDTYQYLENGLVQLKCTFKNGLLNGLYTEFGEDGSYVQMEYLAGKPRYDYYIRSNPNHQMLKMRLSDHTPIWENAAVEELQDEYLNGEHWLYYNKNGVMLALRNSAVKDYGKWYRLELLIANNTPVPITFDPEAIQAYLLSAKDKEEILRVYSCADYMKVVNKKQTWNSVGMGLLMGLSALDAGYSTSTTHSSSYSSGNSTSTGSYSAFGMDGYSFGSAHSSSSYAASTHSTSTTVTYDAAAAFQAQVLAAQTMASFEDAQWSNMKQREEGYFKKTTIQPGEMVAGYVHVKRKKGKALSVIVPIYEAEYLFPWTLTK